MNKCNVVILHGWGHSHQYWQQFEDSLKDDETNVITLDLPGFGEEKLINNDWGIPEYAEWVENRIVKQKLTKVVLLGHSFGGRISSLIASKNPKWLDGLILYASPSIYRPTRVTKLMNKLAGMMKTLGFKLDNFKSEELREAEKLGLGKVFRKIVNFDQSELLPLIKVPTLIVWGEKDSEVPLRVGREMETLIPRSKLVVLEKLGHNVHLENPNIFYGTVKNFLQNL